MATGGIRAIEPGAVLALVGLGITSMASAPVALRNLFVIDLDDERVPDALAASLADVLLHGMLPRADEATPPGAPPGASAC